MPNAPFHIPPADDSVDIRVTPAMEIGEDQIHILKTEPHAGEAVVCACAQVTLDVTLASDGGLDLMERANA